MTDDISRFVTDAESYVELVRQRDAEQAMELRGRIATAMEPVLDIMNEAKAQGFTIDMRIAPRIDGKFVIASLAVFRVFVS